VKVRDGQTGFSYDEQSPAALAAAITRTFQLYRDAPDLLDRIRRRAFAEIYDGHTWDKVLAEGYFPLYARAVSGGSWTRS
jgi:glycogen synthase